MSTTTFARLSFQILLPYVAVALTTLITAFHPSVLQKRFGDSRGVWLYFVLFFLFLLAFPVLVIILAESRPQLVLTSLGLRFGNYRIGLLLMLVGLPIAVLFGYLASLRPEIKEWYPRSKDVCARRNTFIAYEAGNILLYYTAWEFLYRGFLFFLLLHSLGFLQAMAITTAMSTLHHIGYPKSETVAALFAGFIFSVIALYTQSVLYPFAIHAIVGLSTDTFIYLRHYRQGSSR